MNEFQKIWAGRKYRCNTTGVEFTIPDNVRETDFFKVGDGYIDVGRLGFYCRFSNVTEVKDEIHQ